MADTDPLASGTAHQYRVNVPVDINQSPPGSSRHQTAPNNAKLSRSLPGTRALAPDVDARARQERGRAARTKSEYTDLRSQSSDPPSSPSAALRLRQKEAVRRLRNLYCQRTDGFEVLGARYKKVWGTCHQVGAAPTIAVDSLVQSETETQDRARACSRLAERSLSQMRHFFTGANNQWHGGDASHEQCTELHSQRSASPSGSLRDQRTVSCPRQPRTHSEATLDTQGACVSACAGANRRVSLYEDHLFEFFDEEESASGFSPRSHAEENEDRVREWLKSASGCHMALKSRKVGDGKSESREGMAEVKRASKLSGSHWQSAVRFYTNIVEKKLLKRSSSAPLPPSERNSSVG